MFIKSQPYQFEHQITDTRPNRKDEHIHDYNLDKHADDFMARYLVEKTRTELIKL